MTWVAWKMLTADKAKYFGLIFGIAFASLLMAHQVSMFVGIMRRTTSQILDITHAQIWVVDPGVQFLEETRPLADTDLHRVRGVEGVRWAVRLYKGNLQARLPDGSFRQIAVLGLDDATLVGSPQIMVFGDVRDLRRRTLHAR
jgi:putative ABC transport system permease protein